MFRLKDMEQKIKYKSKFIYMLVGQIGLNAFPKDDNIISMDFDIVKINDPDAYVFSVMVHTKNIIIKNQPSNIRLIAIKNISKILIYMKQHFATFCGFKTMPDDYLIHIKSDTCLIATYGNNQIIYAEETGLKNEDYPPELIIQYYPMIPINPFRRRFDSEDGL